MLIHVFWFTNIHEKKMEIRSSPVRLIVNKNNLEDQAKFLCKKAKKHNPDKHKFNS